MCKHHYYILECLYIIFGWYMRRDVTRAFAPVGTK